MIGTGMGMLIGGLASGGGIAYSAKKQSGAVRDAARLQTEASTYGADQELEATRKAEQFQRQQAQAAWADAEAARRANYDQWAARQTSMNAFRTKYGFDPINIPAYVQSADPRYVDDTAEAPPPQYAGPAPDSWRPMPVRPRPHRPVPVGDVGTYAGRPGGYQPYAPAMNPYAVMSVGDVLRRRR